MQKLLLRTILLLCMAICLGCGDSSDPIEEPEQIPSELSKQLWKLTKAVENDADLISSQKEIAEKEAYTINFKDIKNFFGATAVNEMQGTYTVDTVSYKINLKIEKMTEVNETEFGRKYLDILGKVKSYTTSNQELKLIYSDTNYLLYKKSGI